MFQLYRTSCRQKVAFRTHEEAEAKVRVMREYGEELAAYLCGFCDHYHVGHLSKPRERRVLS